MLAKYHVVIQAENRLMLTEGVCKWLCADGARMHTGVRIDLYNAFSAVLQFNF